MRSMLKAIFWRHVWFSGSRGRGYAFKWVGLSLLIGTIAGCGAIVFDVSIDLVTSVLLRGVADTHPPAPVGEGESEINLVFRSVGHPWFLPVVAAIGGLISGLLVFKFAPEAGGGGNDSVISAYHYEAGQIRTRTPFIKLLASAVTIGSGGSAGREGASAQVSAGFGSIVARAFNLTVNERRTCVLIGMGAGIGAIFRAPLGGAILASEMLYREDIETDALIPALIASIAGYSLFSSYAGWDPLFGSQAHLIFNQPVQLVYFAVIGVLAGLLGILFSRTFYMTSRMFSRLTLPDYFKPMIAGFIVGGIGIFVPETLETGYGWIQIAIDGGLPSISLGVLLLLPLVKILTTNLTIGSGGSGGLFGPGVFIGGMLGVGFWRLFHTSLPYMPDSPATFTIIAMIALLGAIAHVPLAVMIMVSEMTRNLSLLAPAMVAVGIATFIVDRETIFRSQLSVKSDSPVHRYRYAFPLLSSLTASEAMEQARVILRGDQSLEQAENLLHGQGLTGGPVVNAQSEFIGILTDAEIAAIQEVARPDILVRDSMRVTRTLFDRTVSLDTVFDALSAENLVWMPIVEGSGSRKLIGSVSFQSVLIAYRQALARKVRRTDAMVIGSTLLEVRVTPGSPLCDQPVRDLDLPEDALLVSYTRRQVVRFPHGDTRFEPGDVVGVVTSKVAEPRIRRFLELDLRTEVIGD